MIDLSPPLEAGLEAESAPTETAPEAPVEMVDMTADIGTDAAQETKQSEDVKKSTTRPNLRLLETEDDDQFDLFAAGPGENFWTEDDQTGADAAAVPGRSLILPPSRYTRGSIVARGTARHAVPRGDRNPINAGSGRNCPPRIRFSPANVNLPLSFG